MYLGLQELVVEECERNKNEGKDWSDVSLMLKRAAWLRGGRDMQILPKLFLTMVKMIISIICYYFGVSETTFYIILKESQEFVVEECESNTKVAWLHQ